MAVPQQLLQQLLALDESMRLEIARALLDSVDGRADDDLSDDERARLNAAIDQSLMEADAGLGVPVEQAIAEIRAKYMARDRVTR